MHITYTILFWWSRKHYLLLTSANCEHNVANWASPNPFILLHEGSSTHRSFVYWRPTELQGGHTPPTVHPFGITRGEQGLASFSITSGSPFATCWWLIIIFCLGQKQHFSPGMHLHANWRCVCGQRWVQPFITNTFRAKHRNNVAIKYKCSIRYTDVVNN